MLSFESDYIEGAHPRILERFIETNMEQLSGYGADCYTASAKEKIAAACSLPLYNEQTGEGSLQIAFLTGGTQTNQIIIDTMLRPYEGVFAATTGHISAHEAGAIEFTGHKVLTLPSHDGKIDAQELDAAVTDFYADGNHEHMVFPGLVYISHPTEYGTLYSKKELTALSETCRKHKLPLFMDGARLGYGLASSESDMSLADIASLCDVFYIGGTKIGALCGEAVVFTHKNMPAHFVNLIKKHGALLAKGRLLGVQFDTLFTDSLYFSISRNAIERADELKTALKSKGYRFFIDSPTNQQFVILENSRIEELKKHVTFSFWEKYDDSHTVVRFATSWATTPEKVSKLISFL
ncbi:MAG: aminotransferase class I/II-fold pyridoxal phosphate-dependent enzyme [Treponema sp.]|nr:aminotransferase class I/II-fold pyridoxal phosphate-dependent enzyme [Treponema sp.]